MNKQLTTKQEIFLDNLIDCEGDAKKAAELAGYAPNSHFQVVKSLKTEILDRTESILAQSAPKAALKLTDIMNSTQPIPQANIRMQAAQTILDRVGIAKTDRIDLKIEAPTGLFILPAKKETVIEYEEEE
tara:strand:+ start:224 stop:613 length:390 start_codon:yes stop_codon:yes gene_type:complete